MAAESNCPTDIESWIEKVIKSVDNPKQFSAARKLIRRYMVRLEEDGLAWHIRNHIDDKFDVLISKERQTLRDKLNTKLNGEH
jgi:hypothetical protein